MRRSPASQILAMLGVWDVFTCLLLTIMVTGTFYDFSHFTAEEDKTTGLRNLLKAVPSIWGSSPHGLKLSIQEIEGSPPTIPSHPASLPETFCTFKKVQHR